MVTEYVEKTCKIGQGSNCCKYLTAGSNGFECAKVDSHLKELIDRKWKIEEHVAQGDNCLGTTDRAILNVK